MPTKNDVAKTAIAVASVIFAGQPQPMQEPAEQFQSSVALAAQHQKHELKETENRSTPVTHNTPAAGSK